MLNPCSACWSRMSAVACYIETRPIDFLRRSITSSSPQPARGNKNAVRMRKRRLREDGNRLTRRPPLFFIGGEKIQSIFISLLILEIHIFVFDDLGMLIITRFSFSQVFAAPRKSSPSGLFGNRSELAGNRSQCRREHDATGAMVGRRCERRRDSCRADVRFSYQSCTIYMPWPYHGPIM